MEALFFGGMEPMSARSSRRLSTDRDIDIRLRLRERAVRMVEETIKQTGERHGMVTRVAVQLGLGSETLRHWVKQAEIDNGQRPGITTKDQQRIAELEKEVRELRRANEILKAAADFFAAYADIGISRIMPSA